METFPLLQYLHEVLEEHTLPLEDTNVGLIEAAWLLDLIGGVEEGYRNNGLL